jgi:hypothetical protein
MKYTLLASSDSENSIIEIIKKYFYADHIFLIGNEIYNSKGIVKFHSVHKKKNRYNFYLNN